MMSLMKRGLIAFGISCLQMSYVLSFVCHPHMRPVRANTFSTFNYNPDPIISDLDLQTIVNTTIESTVFSLQC
jgi:hypothetical protein